jgi:chemotaxis protein MotB
MKNLTVLLTSFLSLVLIAGCVSSGKYKSLEEKQKLTEKDRENYKLELGAAQSHISDLSGKLGLADNQRSQLEDSMSEMRMAIEQQKKRRQETEKRLAEFKELTSKFSKLVNSGRLSVKMLNGRMTVDLSTDILFSSGSARLSADGANAIKEVTLLLKSLEGRNYQIEGHTDNVPIRSEVYPSNWELASARAISVVKTMIEAGMPKERISGASYADTQPVADNSTDEGKKINRRIAIVIVPDLSALPGNEEIDKLIRNEN